MKWGPKAGGKLSDGEWLAKLGKQRGKMPQAIVERPELEPHELPYWDAFTTLHLSRANTGFGPGAIPLSEIVAFCDLMQIPIGEPRAQLVQTIRAMDAAFIEQARTKHG